MEFPPEAFGTREEFDETLKMAKSYAEIMVKSGDSETLIPHLILSGRSKDKFEMHTIVNALLTGFNEDHEKEATLRKVAQNTVDSDFVPIFAALISEAWQAKEMKEGTRPKDNPDRQEVVLIAVSDIRRRWSEMHTMPIVRNDKGHITPGVFENVGEDIETTILYRFFQYTKEAYLKRLK